MIEGKYLNTHITNTNSQTNTDENTNRNTEQILKHISIDLVADASRGRSKETKHESDNKPKKANKSKLNGKYTSQRINNKQQQFNIF